jgi:zinc transport system substrate-binding protein
LGYLDKLAVVTIGKSVILVITLLKFLCLHQRLRSLAIAKMKMRIKIEFFLPLLILANSFVLANEKTVIAASIPPVAMLVQELVPESCEVVTLLPPSASPHTFALRPSDLKKINGAALFVYVSPTLETWASRVPVDNKLELKACYEGLAARSADGDNSDLHDNNDHHSHSHDHHDHSSHDNHSDHAHDDHDHAPNDHLWLNPEAVLSILPVLTSKLKQHLPESDHLTVDEKRIALELDLNKWLSASRSAVASTRHTQFVLMHSAFEPFLATFEWKSTGVIEKQPGVAPAPKHLAHLITSSNGSETVAIITEPQLSERPARVLADSTGLPLIELDPLGGASGKTTFLELYEYNFKQLRSVLPTR